MKEVNIYIKESCDSMSTKEGSYDVLLTTVGKESRFKNSYPDTTNYRMMIQGAIDAIMKLKQPCVVNLYTRSQFGMSSIRHSDGRWRMVTKNSVNADLLEQLRNLVLEQGHELNNYYDKATVDREFFERGDIQSPKRYIVANLPADVYNTLFKCSRKQGVTINELVKEILVSWSRGSDC